MAERRAAPDHPPVSAADIATDPARQHELLGRTVQPEDKRDHPMRAKLTDEQITEAQLDTSLRDLLDGGLFANWKDILAFWRWVKLWRRKPPVPKVRRRVLWEDKLQLDQGNTGHCVGFCWAQWGNSEPVADVLTNADGHAVYYECKVIDGEPGMENGSWTRSGAQAMQQRGRLGEYVFASKVEEIIAWLLTHGPVATGTDWDEPMFDPDTDGYLHPDGNVAGGHDWLIVGYDDGDPNGYTDKEPFFVMQNSWGLGWGVVISDIGDRLVVTNRGSGGRARITVREYRDLFGRDGDACAALELA